MADPCTLWADQVADPSFKQGLGPTGPKGMQVPAVSEAAGFSGP